MPRRSATPAPAVPECRRPVEVGARLGRAGVLALGLAVVTGPAWPASTELVSVGTGGGAGNGDSHTFRPEVSDDGRFVASRTDASNLVAGDTNGLQDVFVRHRQSGAMTRVSLTAGGGQANDQSFGAAISGDGKHVASVSYATNLVAGDGNGLPDIYVRAR